MSAPRTVVGRCTWSTSSTLLVLVLVLPHMLLFRLPRPGDAGAGHLERIEDIVKLLASEQLVAQDQLAKWRPANDRLARDARRRLVAHMRVDGGNHADTAIDVSPHALGVGGESFHQVSAEDREDVGHDADRLEQVKDQYWLHHIQLELAGLRGQADGVIIADHLESHLVDDLGHHW